MFIGAGKLGLPDNAVVAFALGADMVNVGREAMLAIGCIQAQKCHTDHCPTGVATQNPWLAHGLDPALEVGALRELRPDVAPRPAQGRRGDRRRASRPDRDLGDVEILTGQTRAPPLHEVYGYDLGVGLPVRGRPHRDRPPDDGDGAAGQCRPRWRRDPARVGVDGRRS